jgi:hypothetical protein
MPYSQHSAWSATRQKKRRDKNKINPNRPHVGRTLGEVEGRAATKTRPPKQNLFCLRPAEKFGWSMKARPT